MPCCLPPFRISAKILCRNNRKRPYDKEQAILLLSANKKLPAYGRQNPADRKNFYSNLSRHHYSRSFNHALDDASRPRSSERSRECFEGKEGSGYCYGPIEFYMPKYISPCRAVRVHLFPLRSGGNSFFQLYFSQ